MGIDSESHLGILRKNLVKSILDVLILQLLRNKELCGNEIIYKLRERFGAVNYSHVYSTLNNFVKRGLITYANGNGNKRICRLTEQGNLVREQLTQNYIEIDKHIRICFNN